MLHKEKGHANHTLQAPSSNQAILAKWPGWNCLHGLVVLSTDGWNLICWDYNLSEISQLVVTLLCMSCRVTGGVRCSSG